MENKVKKILTLGLISTFHVIMWYVHFLEKDMLYRIFKTYLITEFFFSFFFLNGVGEPPYRVLLGNLGLRKALLGSNCLTRIFQMFLITAQFDSRNIYWVSSMCRAQWPGLLFKSHPPEPDTMDFCPGPLFSFSGLFFCSLD